MGALTTSKLLLPAALPRTVLPYTVKPAVAVTNALAVIGAVLAKIVGELTNNVLLPAALPRTVLPKTVKAELTVTAALAVMLALLVMFAVLAKKAAE